MANKQAQQASKLVQVIRESFRGSKAELQQFSAEYLTKKGDAIVNEAQPHMSERELLAIAHRALQAGY